MGEKGMESPAPLRSGVAGAGELMAPISGVSNMAAGTGTLGGSLAGAMQQATGGALGDAGSNEAQKQDDDMIRRPPEG